jgi:rRNA maturation RNase YbeY
MRPEIYGTRDQNLRADIRRLCRLMTARRGQPAFIVHRWPQRPLSDSASFIVPASSLVNVIFVTNRQIHALNRRFLHRDRPTDVISFNSDEPLCNPRPPSPPIGNRQSAIYNPKLPGEPHLLGEVYISRDRAREQAREYGVSYASELRRLVLHGLLHLLGLTHAQMKPLYARYLGK